MKKSLMTIILTVVFCLSLVFGTVYATNDVEDAACTLNTLGLFNGVGLNSDDSPDFDLERAPTRAEAVAMLVRLIGKEAEALEGTWTTPFNDVPDWAEPYVGYAYSYQLTFGIDETAFGSNRVVSATEFLTFVLRALGYSSGVDFDWNRAWLLSDELRVTDGRFNSATRTFLRGDVAAVSLDALSATLKGSDMTLCTLLIRAGVFTEAAARAAGLGAAISSREAVRPPVETRTPGASEFERAAFILINNERVRNGLNPLLWDAEAAAVARAHSRDMERRGFFSHINPDGNSPGDRMRTGGVTFRYCAENIARGHRTAENVVSAWMASTTGHRHTILSDSAVYMGVGFYDYYWTVDITG